jgi:hypothetical protein
MTTAVTQLTAILNTLAKRARERHAADFTVVVGLVNDLGRLVLRGRESDIRQAQAAVSAVREQLCDDDAVSSPAQALAGPESRSFLAGALWAVSEMMTSRLDAMPSSAGRGRATRSGRVKEMVLGALASGDALSPTAILDSIVQDDPATRLDEVSRAVTEMIAAGLVESVPPPVGTVDRRMKFLVLTAQGQSVAAERLQKA